MLIRQQQCLEPRPFDVVAVVQRQSWLHFEPVQSLLRSLGKHVVTLNPVNYALVQHVEHLHVFHRTRLILRLELQFAALQFDLDDAFLLQRFV